MKRREGYVDVCACQSVLGLEVVLITWCEFGTKAPKNVRHGELCTDFDQTADGDDMADAGLH
jgi:hypothetical protein